MSLSDLMKAHGDREGMQEGGCHQQEKLNVNCKLQSVVKILEIVIKKGRIWMAKVHFPMIQSTISTGQIILHPSYEV